MKTNKLFISKVSDKTRHAQNSLKPDHTSVFRILWALLLFALIMVTLASCSTKDDPGTDPDSPSSSKNAEIVQIETGGGYSLVLLSDNTLWGTGANIDYQLGLDNTSKRNTLTKIADKVRFVKAFDGSTVIIKTDDTLWGSGSNLYGHFGIGDITKLQTFTKLTDNVKSISGGEDHLLIIKKDNTLWGAGHNEMHAIRNDGTGEHRDVVLIPVKMADNVKEAVGGSDFTLILKNDNTVWGRGNKSRIGARDVGEIGGSTDWVQKAYGAKKVMAGSGHSGILLSDNSLWLTGNSGSGQLGIGLIGFGGYNTEYVMVAENVKDAMLGTFTSLILYEDDSLWGSGELTSKAFEGVDTFEKMADGVLAASFNSRHGLVLKKDKTLMAIGWNGSGQLGDRTYEDTEVLVPVYLTWKEGN